MKLCVCEKQPECKLFSFLSSSLSAWATVFLLKSDRVRPLTSLTISAESLMVAVMAVTVGGPGGCLVWCLMESLVGNAQPKLGTPLLMDRPVDWIRKKKKSTFIRVILSLFQMRVSRVSLQEVVVFLKVSRNVVQAAVGSEDKDDTNKKKWGDW